MRVMEVRAWAILSTLEGVIRMVMTQSMIQPVKVNTFFLIGRYKMVTSTPMNTPSRAPLDPLMNNPKSPVQAKTEVITRYNLGAGMKSTNALKNIQTTADNPKAFGSKNPADNLPAAWYPPRANVQKNPAPYERQSFVRNLLESVNDAIAYPKRMSRKNLKRAIPGDSTGRTNPSLKRMISTYLNIRSSGKMRTYVINVWKQMNSRYMFNHLGNMIFRLNNNQERMSRADMTTKIFDRSKLDTFCNPAPHGIKNTARRAKTLETLNFSLLGFILKLY